VDSSHGLVGESLPIRQIRKQIERLGHSRSRCFCSARAARAGSRCGAHSQTANPCCKFHSHRLRSLVGPLMESELFGHTRGAFTGAAEASAA